MHGACDGWEEITGDLIDRFIDVTRVEQVLPRGGAHWRADLLALDGWMRYHHGKTLVTARGTELREYLHAMLDDGLDPQSLGAVLACLGRFYRYLWKSGCRPDLLRVAPFCLPPPRLHATEPPLMAGEGG